MPVARPGSLWYQKELFGILEEFSQFHLKRSEKIRRPFLVDFVKLET